MLTCEVRDSAKGVIYFGRTNCNYILFPGGIVVENYGYHGRALMDHIREVGAKVALREIIAKRQEIQEILDRLDCHSIKLDSEVTHG